MKQNRITNSKKTSRRNFVLGSSAVALSIASSKFIPRAQQSAESEALGFSKISSLSITMGS